MLPAALKWRLSMHEPCEPPELRHTLTRAMAITMQTPNSFRLFSPKIAIDSEFNRVKPQRKRLVLGCGALVYELVELIKHNSVVDQAVDLHCLPANLHNTPQLIGPEVDDFLSKHAHRYSDVLVAYGDCGSAGELDRVLEKHQAKRLPGAHCYEFFSGTDVFQNLMDEELGSFFLTDFLVTFFDRLVTQGLGLDRYPEFKQVYFKHYKKLVYLAQKDDPELQALAKQHALYLELDYEYKFVGFDGLKPVTFGLDKNLKLSNIEVQHVST